MTVAVAVVIDSSNIHIPSIYISRASYLLLQDLYAELPSPASSPPGSANTDPDPFETHKYLTVSIDEGEGWEWPLTDMLVVVLLLPSLLTILTVVMNRWRAMR